MPTPSEISRPQILSAEARNVTSSVIRDLLEHARRPGMISLAGGLPDSGRFPTLELGHLTSRLLADDPEILQYGLTAGDPGLRSRIAAEHDTDSDSVIITTGSQQALSLIARALLDPGDTVVVAQAEYLGALQAFRGRGAKLVAVPFDSDGIDLDTLTQLIGDRLRPRLVYTVPNFHNPTGSTLSPSRRKRLADLADSYDFLVIEDDPYRELWFDTPPQPVSAGPSNILLRSASKILAPGLRVGWMVAPTWVAAAVERLKQATDLHTCSLSQALVDAAMQADWFADHVRGLRADGGPRRDTLRLALSEAFGDRLEVNRPAGGMFLWARFTDGTNTTDLLDAALEAGVAFVPGQAFAVDQDLRSALRMSWAGAETSELELAAERLAAAHRER